MSLNSIREDDGFTYLNEHTEGHHWQESLYHNVVCTKCGLCYSCKGCYWTFSDFSLMIHDPITGYGYHLDGETIRNTGLHHKCSGSQKALAKIISQYPIRQRKGWLELSRHLYKSEEKTEKP